MMNFTLEIKREIMTTGFPDTRSIDAFLCAFILSSGNVFPKTSSFQIVTETELTAEYFINLMESNHGLSLAIRQIETERLRGRDRFVFEAKGEKTEAVLRKIGLIKNHAISNLDFLFDLDLQTKIAFVKGYFLGSGSCTVPTIDPQNKTGYHLEFVFSDMEQADTFLELLLELDLFAKKIERKSSIVLYIQSREGISDFLHLISAERCLNKLNELVEEREQNNLGTRVNNCYVSNIDRTAAISAEQCRYIRLLETQGVLEELSVDLRDVANMRLAFPMDNYQQLADKLGLTKSSLSRKLKRLLDLGKNLAEDKI